MSRKSIEEEEIKRSLESREPSLTDLSNSMTEERIPVSDRPKILISSPSTQRLIRSQPFHYYHPHQPSKYSSIEEDNWESCMDVSVRSSTSASAATAVTGVTTATTATTAAIHSRPESVSRASSHSTSQSNQSNPYNR